MGAMGKDGGSNDTPEMEHAVEDLLRRAAEHPLGADFLARGSLDAVAATFEVHAFVVDAARDALLARRPVEASASALERLEQVVCRVEVQAAEQVGRQ